MTQQQPADVCLILEGTYPYVPGGVASWTHSLIQAQKHLRFALVTLVSSDQKLDPCFDLPDNVVEHKNIHLQDLSSGVDSIPHQKEFFRRLKEALVNLSNSPSLKALSSLTQLLATHKQQLGRNLLLNSNDAWKMCQEVYEETFPTESFLDFFWSWRALTGSLFSTLLTPLPTARCYHALCTGYGGITLARAHIETQRPCLLTEHGIYTNERRIEIASADWLQSHRHADIRTEGHQRNLRDFWMDTFTSYSKVCYEACSAIVTLFEANQSFQIKDGASKSKLRVIPNGINVDRFVDLPRNNNSSTPTIALIGRVVSIKDIKSFLRCCAILRETYPTLRAWVLGPTEEEPEYFQECQSLTEHLCLEETVSFMGKVNLVDYFPEVDVLALTSISEAQPLVLLEAGAAGVPCVATDVGDCRDLLLGRNDEDRELGPGGIICALADPEDIAQATSRLLSDQNLARQMATNAKKRVTRYYSKTLQTQRYRKLYKKHLDTSSTDLATHHP